MKRLLKLVIVVISIYGICYFLTMKKAASNFLSCSKTLKPMEKLKLGEDENQIILEFKGCMKSNFNFIDRAILPDSEISVEFTN